MQNIVGRGLAAIASIAILSVAAAVSAQQFVAQGSLKMAPAEASGFMLGEAGRTSSLLLPRPGLNKADAPKTEALPDGRPTPYIDGRENGGVFGLSYRLQPNPQAPERRTAPESYPGRPQR